MKWVKKRDVDIVNGAVTGLLYDFSDCDYKQVSSGDLDGFILAGYEIVEANENPCRIEPKEMEKEECVPEFLEDAPEEAPEEPAEEGETPKKRGKKKVK